MVKKRVVIIGAGFGGISALNQLIKEPDYFEVFLISPKSHFEYYPGLYRLFSDHIPFEVFVPLRYMINPTVQFIHTSVTEVDLLAKKVKTQSGGIYEYDVLIIATGSVATNFGIPGVFEHGYFVSSLARTYEAKNALFESIEKHIVLKKTEPYMITIAGAGPTGVELAGELSVLLDTFSKSYGYPRSHLKITLVQRDPVILSQLPSSVQNIANHRLKKLRVALLVNTSILEVTENTLITDQGSIPYSFFFWSAGAKTNELILNTKSIPLSTRKKIIVNENLQIREYPDVYALGDNAETIFSGLAQIAEQDGEYVGKLLVSQIKRTTIKPYTPRQPIYVIPIGKWFGILGTKKYVFVGILPSLLRYIVDARFFFLHLKLKHFISLSFERKLK